MPLPPLFSERNTPLPTIFTYDSIPAGLKNQIIHIWKDFYFENAFLSVEEVRGVWTMLNEQIARRHGMEKLVASYSLQRRSSYSEVKDYFKECSDVFINLDLIQRSFNFMKIGEDHHARQYLPQLRFNYEDSVNELNRYFRENGVGFQYENGEIIKVDSQLLHQEIIQPVLKLLNDSLFENANKEYLDAHEYYKNNDFKACMIFCGKCLESTMKIICIDKGWDYGDGTASKLFTACFTNHLVPSYLQDHFNGIRKTMEAATTLRNRVAHGSGATSIEVPPHFATYVLNLTGTTIKFLYDCFRVLG